MRVWKGWRILGVAAVCLTFSACGTTGDSATTLPESTGATVATISTSATATTEMPTTSTVPVTTTLKLATTTSTPATTTTTLKGSPLEIVTVRYDAPGNDNDNLNAEYVVFKVLVSMSLLGYAIEDRGADHRYDFPDRAFEEGQTFTLHTGEGTDTQADLYWGQSGTAVWNNGGDTVKVISPQGETVESQAYTAN
jgi:competence protein ComEC